MTIITKQDPENFQVLQIFLDNQFCRKINKSYYRKKDDFFNVSSLKQLFFYLEKLEFEQGKKYAFFLLAKKNYSINDFVEKLQKKAICQKNINAILLVCKKYLSDEKVISSTIERLLNKGYGVKYIAYKLKQKKFAYQDFEKYLLEISSKKETEVLTKLLLKKFKNIDVKEKKFKIVAYLQNRGFELDTILRTLENKYE